MDMHIDHCLEITSKHNANIKKLLHLRKKKNRKDSELFLIEGCREIYQALKNDFCFESVFICRDYIRKEEEKVLINIFQEKNIKIFLVSKNIFLSICYKENPEPFLALAYTRYFTCSQFFLRKKEKKPLYLLVESIEKPGNLGALLRNCDAVGIDGMVICDPILDIFNPNVIRASLGTVFSVPILLIEKEDIFQIFKEQGLQIVVTTPQGTISYLDLNFTLPSVIVMGSEKDGVSSFWLEKGDVLSFIPMKGSADSLNVAMSATVFLYEAIRQRQFN